MNWPPDVPTSTSRVSSSLKLIAWTEPDTNRLASSSGNRTRRAGKVTYRNSVLAGVPHRRGIGPVLYCRRDDVGTVDAEERGIVGSPARCGNLEYTHVVETILLWIEIGVCPVCCEH